MTVSRPPLSRGDLAFLLEANEVPPEECDRMGRRLARDPGYRRALVDNEEIFERALQDTDGLVDISPALLFEILLHKVRADLRELCFTVEQAGGMSVPVFDSEEVLDLLEDELVMAYLVGMLASFVQPAASTVEQQGKGRVTRRLRYSDLDLHSLLRLAEGASGAQRLTVYRRVADACLFMLGIYPEFVVSNHRYPSGELRPLLAGSGRRFSPEEYEARGRQFYRLAAEHRSARGRRLADVLWSLHAGFSWALKPLNFLSANYLHRAGVLLT